MCEGEGEGEGEDTTILAKYHGVLLTTIGDYLLNNIATCIIRTKVWFITWGDF